MSTRGVGVTQQMFKNQSMGIGSRIKSRLDELGWQRKHLYDALPDLTARHNPALKHTSNARIAANWC